MPTTARGAPVHAARAPLPTFDLTGSFMTDMLQKFSDTPVTEAAGHTEPAVVDTGRKANRGRRGIKGEVRVRA